MTLTAAPPAATASRWRRMRPALGTAAAIGLASTALRLRDPHQQGSWGLCPLNAMTGWDCPFCGGLRAVNDLTHGDVGSAWHSNALFVSSIPLLVVLWLVWAGRSWNGERRRLSDRSARVTALVVGVIALAFAVYRNTPWGSAFSAS